jgi:hypothetical protein
MSPDFVATGGVTIERPTQRPKASNHVAMFKSGQLSHE